MLRAFRFPLAVVLGLVLWLGVVDRDPAGALVVLGTVGAVLALVAAGQLLGRARVRRRRRTLPPGSGVWRAHVDDGLAVARLFRGGRASWLVDVVHLDVGVAPAGVVLLPRNRVGGLQPLRLAWDEVAAVTVGDRTWELHGRPRPLPLLPVTLALVGRHVDDLHRPMTDVEARDEGFDAHERAVWDDDLRRDLREQHGSSYVFGTRPLTLLVEDADGLVPLLQRHRSGVLPDSSR